MNPRFRLLFATLFLSFLPLGLSVLSATNNAVDPPAEGVRWPDRFTTGPIPGTTLTLSPEMYYVIETDVEGVVRGYPGGYVNITKEAGPIRLRGRFVDGTGKIETRTYKGANVFIIDPVKSRDEVELVFTPFGFKLETDIKSRTVRVDMGDAPRPPPQPEPKPTPGPLDPDPDTRPAPNPNKVDSLWIIIVEETSARTPDIARVVNDVVFWNAVKARGHDVRFYDVSSAEAKQYGYDRRATSGPGLPALILYDKKANNGMPLKAVRLPPTTALVDIEIKAVSK